MGYPLCGDDLTLTYTIYETSEHQLPPGILRFSDTGGRRPIKLEAAQNCTCERPSRWQAQLQPEVRTAQLFLAFSRVQISLFQQSVLGPRRSVGEPPPRLSTPVGMSFQICVTTYEYVCLCVIVRRECCWL